MNELENQFPTFLLYFTAVQRWNYFKVRSVSDRHWEELHHLDREMFSVPLFMEHNVRKWRNVAEESLELDREGLRCYARRQGAMWQRFASEAREIFAPLASERMLALGKDSFVLADRTNVENS